MHTPRTLITLLAAITCLAADVKEPPKLSETLLKERWKALAIYHSQKAQALEMQIRLSQAEAAYQAAITALKAACGQGFELDETGPEMVCRVKARPEEVKK